MFEKAIEIVLGLAVGAAGMFGISTAADANGHATADADATVRVATPDAAETVDDAQDRVDRVRALIHGAIDAAATVGVMADVETPVADGSAGLAGQANAAEAVQHALDAAPEPARAGLEHALDQIVSDVPAVDAGASIGADVHADVDLP